MAQVAQTVPIAYWAVGVQVAQAVVAQQVYWQEQPSPAAWALLARAFGESLLWTLDWQEIDLRSTHSAFQAAFQDWEAVLAAAALG